MHEIANYSETDTMLLPDIQMLANNLMLEHGLIEKGWYFTFDRAKKRLGACHYGPKKITMSSLISPGQSKDKIRNTILHEIAHALVGHKHGHDAVWEAKAREIGCDGKRCGSVDTPVVARWVSVCDNCEKRGAGFHRAPNRVRACSLCSGGKFDPEFILRWEEWGRQVDHYKMNDKYAAEYRAIMQRHNGARLRIAAQNFDYS